MNASRRRILAGFAAALFASSGSTRAAKAAEQVRIGVLGAATGPLAGLGNQVLQGLNLYLKDRGHQLGGRTVNVIPYDTQGRPELAAQGVRKLVEGDRVHLIIGPITTPEALAVSNYVLETKMPTLSIASAAQLTQRASNPWYLRVSAASSQATSVLADFAVRTRRYARIASIIDDNTLGYELSGGFQQVLEDAGGRITQKILVSPDSSDFSYIFPRLDVALDALFVGVAGTRGLSLIGAARKFGISLPVLTTFSTADLSAASLMNDLLLREIGNQIVDTISATWYFTDLETPPNENFVYAMRKEYGIKPTLIAAAGYICGGVIERALLDFRGDVGDAASLMQALKKVSLSETLRGPVHFDDYGNVVGNMYITQIVNRTSGIGNALIKTYPEVSQFWTYGPRDILSRPPSSREYPPSNYLEKKF